MFGCHAVYVEGKIVFVLRDKGRATRSATTGFGSQRKSQQAAKIGRRRDAAAAAQSACLRATAHPL
jgi:hypothetical protein